uniref:Uncharacterized protein n=1 Tax=Anopheles coluzzii TaxID=1518534 RepID=A0A8W7PDW6_ANOCL
MAAQNLPNIKRINPGLAGRCSSTTDRAYRPPGFPVFLCDASVSFRDVRTLYAHMMLSLSSSPQSVDGSGRNCQREVKYSTRHDCQSECHRLKRTHLEGSKTANLNPDAIDWV